MIKRFGFVVLAVLLTVGFVYAGDSYTNVLDEGDFSHLALSDSGLVLYYSFDTDTSSTTVYDYSALSGDGKIEGNVQQVSSGIYGGAFDFTGVNGDHVEVSNSHTPINFAGATEVSFSAWIKPDFDETASSSYYLLDKGAGSYRVRFLAGLDDFDWLVVTTGNNGKCSSSGLDWNVGEWHHIAGYMDTTNGLHLYWDGVEVCNDNVVTGTIKGNSLPFRVGEQAGNGASWDGIIDEVMLWNVSIGESTILEIYNSSYTRFYSTGEEVFNNVDASVLGDENLVNVSLTELNDFSGTSFGIVVGDNVGNGYNYGQEFGVVNGIASDIPVSTPSNLSVKVVYHSDINGFYTPIMIGDVSVIGFSSNSSGGGNESYPILGDMLFGGNQNTLNVLYQGNSRIQRTIGFAFDGVENIAFDQGRLAGDAFVIPLKGYSQQNEDVHYLFNGGPSMGATPTNWRALDNTTLYHSVGNKAALELIPERSVKMANFGDDVVFLPKDEEVILTVQYLVGPDKGVFNVTPVEVSGNSDIVYSHPSTQIDTFAPNYSAEYLKIVLPVMNNASLNRAFVLEGVSGTVSVYRVNTERDIAEGIAVSEMAVGGVDFDRQRRFTDADSWTTYVEAFDPHVVMWQYAGNSQPNVTLLIEATKELMDRVDSVNPDALHILTLDHPTPRPDWQTPYYRSREWANGLEGYHGAIIVDPEPYLPQDFLDLAGTGNLSIYFMNQVHENHYGAYVVGNATWQAMEQFYIDANN